MKTFSTIFLSIFITFTVAAQEQREVLVEIFTNSHCPLCPAAHNTIDNFLNTSPNADKINYIYYHMVYPYPTDLLYTQSAMDSDARHAYYAQAPATPRGIFDGVPQGSSSGWITTLNNLTQTQSPLKILLSGTRSNPEFQITANVTRTGNITDTDLVLHFVVVEDVYYNGNNSISDHKHVMRKMLPTSSGLPITINLNESKNYQQTILLDQLWDADSLNVVVFVQSTSSKTVYQSETISYDDLTVTGVEDQRVVPDNFILFQNYPNPFNPSTKIKFQIAKDGFTSIKIFNVLGNEVKTLVNNNLSAGSYEFDFNAADLSSGTYFYTLTSGDYKQTKKMILIK